MALPAYQRRGTGAPCRSLAVLDRLRSAKSGDPRWTGRFFLLGGGAGIVGAIGLSATATLDWGFVNGIRGPALAWFVTTAMAYYTNRKGLVSLHKEWMIRAYVVTFAFVTFRFPQGCSPLSRVARRVTAIPPSGGRARCVPLAITEMVFQVRRLRTALAARRSG
jgi:hypothetical protein